MSDRCVEHLLLEITEILARFVGFVGSRLQRWGSVISVRLVGSVFTEITEISVTFVGACVLRSQRSLLDLLDGLDLCYRGVAP